MAKQEININQLPTGLAKEDFINLPELKSVRSWYTWAGVVGIVSGLLGFASLGQAAELQAQGYSVNMGFVVFFAALSVVSIVLGIMLLKKKSSTVAYALGGLGLLMAVIALASGGTVGAGIIATVLAIIGARKIDKLWAEYQAAGLHQ